MTRTRRTTYGRFRKSFRPQPFPNRPNPTGFSFLRNFFWHGLLVVAFATLSERGAGPPEGAFLFAIGGGFVRFCGPRQPRRGVRFFFSFLPYYLVRRCISVKHVGVGVCLHERYHGGLRPLRPAPSFQRPHEPHAARLVMSLEDVGLMLTYSVQFSSVQFITVARGGGKGTRGKSSRSVVMMSVVMMSSPIMALTLDAL